MRSSWSCLDRMSSLKSSFTLFFACSKQKNCTHSVSYAMKCEFLFPSESKYCWEEELSNAEKHCCRNLHWSLYFENNVSLYWYSQRSKIKRKKFKWWKQQWKNSREGLARYEIVYVWGWVQVEVKRKGVMLTNRQEGSLACRQMEKSLYSEL